MAKSELSRLQAAHNQESRELAAAQQAADAAEQARINAAVDLADQRSLLDQLEGREPMTADAAVLDPDEVAKKVRALVRDLASKEDAAGKAAERLKVARKVEKDAFYALVRQQHRESVRALLACERQLHRLLADERQIRQRVCDREGGFVGSLPVFASPRYDSAVTSHRVKEAIECGYVSPEEQSQF